MNQEKKEIKEIVFLGASTAFYEITHLITDINKSNDFVYKVIAILDDAPSKHGQSMEGIPIVGGLSLITEYPNCQFVFGIGSHKTRNLRHKIIEQLQVPVERFVTLIHPTAIVYPHVTVGPGSIIHAGAVVGNHVKIGSFVILTFNTVIGAYGQVGDYSMITTAVVVLTNVTIEESVFIGAASTIAENLTIGAGAMIGMATAVYRDIRPGHYVLGNPARMLYQTKID